MLHAPRPPGGKQYSRRRGETDVAFSQLRNFQRLPSTSQKAKMLGMDLGSFGVLDLEMVPEDEQQQVFSTSEKRREKPSSSTTPNSKKRPLSSSSRNSAGVVDQKPQKTTTAMFRLPLPPKVLASKSQKAAAQTSRPPPVVTTSTAAVFSRQKQEQKRRRQMEAEEKISLHKKYSSSSSTTPKVKEKEQEMADEKKRLQEQLKANLQQTAKGIRALQALRLYREYLTPEEQDDILDFDIIHYVGLKNKKQNGEQKNKSLQIEQKKRKVEEDVVSGGKTLQFGETEPSSESTTTEEEGGGSSKTTPNRKSTTTGQGGMKRGLQPHDHIAFQYEILGKLDDDGWYGQLLMCYDYKASQHVAMTCMTLSEEALSTAVQHFREMCPGEYQRTEDRNYGMKAPVWGRKAWDPSSASGTNSNPNEMKGKSIQKENSEGSKNRIPSYISALGNLHPRHLTFKPLDRFIFRGKLCTTCPLEPQTIQLMCAQPEVESKMLRVFTPSPMKSSSGRYSNKGREKAGKEKKEETKKEGKEKRELDGEKMQEEDEKHHTYDDDDDDFESDASSPTKEPKKLGEKETEEKKGTKSTSEIQKEPSGTTTEKEEDEDDQPRKGEKNGGVTVKKYVSDWSEFLSEYEREKEIFFYDCVYYGGVEALKLDGFIESEDEQEDGEHQDVSKSSKKSIQRKKRGAEDQGRNPFQTALDIKKMRKKEERKQRRMERKKNKKKEGEEEEDEEVCQNGGYDDARGDYKMVKHDHVAYRYEIISMLGKGSFGQVYKVFDHKVGIFVALKIIRNEEKFHRQAKVEMRVLHHLRTCDPDDEYHNVKMLHFFQFRNHVVMTFELHNMNLYELATINEYRPFPKKDIQVISRQLVQSMMLMYEEHIIHCDMKPENILLAGEDSLEIKVIDFGSSCFDNERIYTYIQSRFYRAPELLLGLGYGRRIDMWSVGCIICEMALGFPIFPGETEADLMARIIEVCGMPEDEFINESSRAGQYFQWNEDRFSAIMPPDSRGKRRVPGAKPLDKVLAHYRDPEFVEFVKIFLMWDPKERATPHEAIRHPWLWR